MAIEIAKVVVGFIVMTLISILVDRNVNTTAAVIVLCLGLIFLAYVDRGDIKMLFTKHSPVANNQPSSSPLPPLKVVPDKPQRVLMVLLGDGDGGRFRIVHDPNHLDSGLFINLRCTNESTNVTAKNVVCVAHAEQVPTDGGIPTKQTEENNWSVFANLLAKEKKSSTLDDLDPQKAMWTSAELGKIDPGLTTGDKVILFMGAVAYRDDAGPHQKEICMWAQPPPERDPVVWGLCGIGHNHGAY
jgi:hypothetical protein